MKTNSPLRRSKAFLLAGMLALGAIGTAQTTSVKVFEDWSTENGSQHNFQRSIVRSKTLGGSTYYYVAGATLNASGNYDLIVSKMTVNGGILWTQTYNGAGNADDYATDVQIDAVGNVYVCGAYYKDATDSSNALVIKYNTAGVHKWTKTYNGAGSRNDIFAAMQVAGNVLVAVGSAWTGTTNKYDMLAVRLDSSGNQVWASTWDYTGLYDGAVNLYNSGTKIYIAGGAQSAATTYKYAVVSLKLSDGSFQSATVTGGTAFGFDQITDIQVEAATGNIFVTGGVINTGTLYDYKTVKLDTALNIIWSASYSSAGAYNDVASGLYIDSLGNIIVTGYATSATQGRNYATVKYNSAGTQQWVSTFNGDANGNDTATAIVTLGSDIYVTGASYNGSNYDYYTIKYDASGNQKWGISWNSAPNFSDRPTAIAVDTLRRIVVSGQTKESGSTYSYMTVCYSEMSVIVPPDTAAAGSSAFLFTVNRGQLRDLSYASDTKAKYYCQGTSPEVYFQNESKISFQKSKIDTVVATTDSIVQVDMEYSGANFIRPRAFNEAEKRNSYFLSHIPDGAVNIKNFENVIYPGLYSNIDLEFGSHAGGVKHSYIIKPGGNPTDIDFTFAGASSVTVSGTTLRIATALGNIDFPQASAFQIDGSGNFVALGWQPTYSVASGHVTFGSIGAYDAAKTLVIVIRVGSKNPVSAANGNLEWCSFGGTTNDDYFFDVCRVALGEVAVGSTMFTGFSGQPGQFTGNFAGIQDGIMMYYKNDIPQFHCYIGGTGSDAINAVCLNGNDVSNAYIFFAGGGSPTGITPHGPGSPALTQAHAGAHDAYVGCMNVSFGGNFNIDFPWFTYFGGAGGEVIHDIFWDAGNLYFTGQGSSGTPMKTETGAYNNATGTMLLGKFNYADSLMWSTHFGSGIGYGIYRRNNWLAVTGTITTTTLPITTPPSWMPFIDNTRSGGEAFLLQFDGVDNIVWSTYVGGTGNESGESIAIDRNNDIYICGNTTSSDFPYKWQGTTNGYIDSAYSASSDGYMAKFNSSGHQIWGSYYGNTLGESFNEVCIDSLNNVYFLGVAGSTNASMLNGGTTVYNQTTINDNLANASYSDGCIMMLDHNLDRKWCTYFGGNNPEYILGGSISEEYPQTLVFAGASQSTSNFPWYGANAINTNADGNGNFYDGFEARMTLTNIIVLSTPEEQEMQDNNIILYPNPSDGNITLQLVAGADAPQNLKIYNALGQVVFEQNQPFVDATGKIVLDLSMLNTGVYFVNLQYSDAIRTEQFSIMR